MKIEKIVPQPTIALERRQKQHPPERLPGNQGDEAYRVKLSALAGQSTPESDEEEIRRARVAAIRDQLASGTYNISGKDVASKILDALKN